MKRIRVGVAGWSNPPAKRSDRQSGQSHLAYYTDHFSCVEINSSFSRPHRGTTYARWRDETPAHFRFSVKMPRSVTHEAALRGTAAEVSHFFEDIRNLQPKLAAVLVQLAPSLEFDATTARSFFESMPRLAGTSVVCEPRHGSWFTPSADDTMRRFDVSRVAADPPRCAGSETPGGARNLAYFRWHGAPRMYYSQYSDTQLAACAANVKIDVALDTWCIFDNTARYAAWDDALRFKALIDHE